MAVVGAAEIGRIIVSIDFDKLDFFGDEYLLQHLTIEADKRRRDDDYKFYVTKALEIIAKNTGNLAAGERQGYNMPMSYLELTEPQTGNKNGAAAEEQSPAEIKKKILGRFKRMRGEK